MPRPLAYFVAGVAALASIRPGPAVRYLPVEPWQWQDRLRPVDMDLGRTPETSHVDDHWFFHDHDHHDHAHGHDHHAHDHGHTALSEARPASANSSSASTSSSPPLQASASDMGTAHVSAAEAHAAGDDVEPSGMDTAELSRAIAARLVEQQRWVATCTSAWFRKRVEHYRFEPAGDDGALRCSMAGTFRTWHLTPASYRGLALSNDTAPPRLVFRESPEDEALKPSEYRLAFWLANMSGSAHLLVAWVDVERDRLHSVRPRCIEGSDRAGLLFGHRAGH